jgi:ribonuclease P protein component
MHGKAVHAAPVLLSWLPTRQSASRFGFVVGKRVGNAVTRNRVKRRLRAIVHARLSSIRAGFDITIIARPSSASCSYGDLETLIETLLRRARLWQSGTIVQSGQETDAKPPTSSVE